MGFPVMLYLCLGGRFAGGWSCLLQFGRFLALHSSTESHNLDNSYLVVSSLFQRADQLGDEEIFRREVQKGRSQWPHVWYNCKLGLTWANGEV